MMLPSRGRLLLSGLAVALLGACDRPTAPEARDQIEKAQRGVLEGRLSLGDLAPLFYNSVGPFVWFSADSLTVERDGESTRYLAHVMERVYLPPPRSGGRPYVARTLLAWDKENHRGLAFAADDSVADIVSPTDALTAGGSPGRIWHRPAFAVQSERDAHEAWFGTEGRIDFGVATKVGTCSLAQENGPVRFPVPEGGTRLATTCDDVRFTVSGTTLLEKRGASKAGFLDRWTASRMPVRFDAQSIRGTRITTQCPDVLDPRMLPPPQCTTYLLFWRDPAQFAPGLGLDLTRIERGSDNMDEYVEMAAPGSGVSFSHDPSIHGLKCCTTYVGPAHYAVRAPDGTTLREVEVAVASEDPLLKRFNWSSLRAFKDGSRVLLFIRGDQFDRSISFFTPLIVDIRVLPCPADKVRDTAPVFGQPFSFGGCSLRP